MIKLTEKHPPVGFPLILHHPDWVCADFNPSGMREGHWNCNGGAFDWESAAWSDCAGQWVVDHQQPTHWDHMPERPEEQEQ